MLKALVLVVSVVGLVGCGQSGPCKARTGNTYRVNFDRRDGNCGDLPEQVVVLDDTTPPGDLGCSGTRTLSEDRCEATSNQLTCPTPDGYGRFTGTLSWNTEGSSGTGTLSFSVLDSGMSVICQGTYDATYTKL